MLLIFYYSNLFSWLLKLLPCNHILYLILSSLCSRYLLSTGHNPQEGIRDDRQELKEENPGSLHSMLSQKQPRHEVIDLFRARKRKHNFNCPPTCTGNISTPNAHTHTVSRFRINY